jgi:hypothetical protein
MTNAVHLASRGRSGRCPPERFHVFVSYTTREDEVRIVKPTVDHFLNSVLRPVIERTLGEPPAFYDGYTLYNPSGSPIWYPVLENALRFAIEESEILVAFLSPEYFESRWCTLECAAMAAKERRPWFDLCRTPPIAELADRRAPGRKPTWWQCLWARFLMRRWRSLDKSWTPGGVIVPVLWKGQSDLLRQMPDMEKWQLFDWTSCRRAFEVWERVGSHQLRHGSVSPIWVSEAEVFDKICLESMRATAEAITDILVQRRLEYARNE